MPDRSYAQGGLIALTYAALSITWSPACTRGDEVLGEASGLSPKSLGKSDRFFPTVSRRQDAAGRTRPRLRKGGTRYLPDDSGDLLRDNVMEHVTGIRHVAERGLPQCGAQASGLPIRADNLIPRPAIIAIGIESSG